MGLKNQPWLTSWPDHEDFYKHWETSSFCLRVRPAMDQQPCLSSSTCSLSHHPTLDNFYGWTDIFWWSNLCGGLFCFIILYGNDCYWCHGTAVWQAMRVPYSEYFRLLNILPCLQNVSKFISSRKTQMWPNHNRRKCLNVINIDVCNCNCNRKLLEL